MTTNTNRQVLLKRRPVGRPVADDFEIVNAPMPLVDEGDVLRRTIYLSLDPYMRGRMNDGPSYATPVAIGQTTALAIRITPNPGIHVYAPGAKGYLPIALTLTPQRHLTAGKTVYPKSEMLLFVPLGESVPVYQKPFRLIRDVALAASIKPGTTVNVVGTIDYQACDDKVCFAPASVPVRWTVAVRP